LFHEGYEENGEPLTTDGSRCKYRSMAWRGIDWFKKTLDEEALKAKVWAESRVGTTRGKPNRPEDLRLSGKAIRESMLNLWKKMYGRPGVSSAGQRGMNVLIFWVCC